MSLIWENTEMESISGRVLGKLFWEQDQWRGLWEWWTWRRKSLMSPRNGRQGKIEVPLPGTPRCMPMSPNIKVTLEPENVGGRGSHTFSRLLRSAWSRVVNMSHTCCNHLWHVHGRCYKLIKPSLPHNPNSISIQNARYITHQMVTGCQKKTICSMGSGVSLNTRLWIQVKGRVIQAWLKPTGTFPLILSLCSHSRRTHTSFHDCAIMGS